MAKLEYKYVFNFFFLVLSVLIGFALCTDCFFSPKIYKINTKPI